MAHGPRLEPADRSVAGTEAFSSLVTLLRHRAAAQPDERAYVFLSDRGTQEATLTFGELWSAARAHASRLAASVEPGERALLVFPPGLEFLVAVSACQIVGVIAVPMMVPRRNSTRDASANIVAMRARNRPHQPGACRS